MLLYVLIAWSVTGDFKRSRWVYLRQIAWWITVFFFIGRVFNNFFFRLKRTGSSSFTLLAKYYHCRINFVNLFQLCVVIYLAFKVRVWSTSKKNSLPYLKLNNFLLLFLILNKNSTPCLEPTVEYQVTWNQCSILKARFMKSVDLCTHKD